MNRSITEDKYQVWITSYAMDGASEASKYDPGYQLKGTYKTIEEAVNAHLQNIDYVPVITKLVTWRTRITDTSDFPNLLGGVCSPAESGQ